MNLCADYSRRLESTDELYLAPEASSTADLLLFFDRLFAADIQFNNSTITLISYYNPPKEPLSTQLFQYASNLNQSIILGDFNARHTDFGDTSSNANGKIFSKLISELPIYRLENRNPTHIAGSILDHIVISENLIPHVDPHTFIGTTVTSDHLPLVAQLIRDTPPRTPQPIQIFDYKKADWNQFRREITKTLPHKHIT
jgi:hypothetical protein